MADFNKPEVTQTYIQLLQDIRDNQEELAKMFSGVTPANTPAGAVRFANNRFSTYNGSAWVDTPVGITGGGTGAANPSAARTALSVLEAGTGGTQARNNAENDAKFVDKTRTVSTSGALSGGGDLSANRTLTVRNASTTQTGVVQLESGLESTSTTTAATASTVKQLKDQQLYYETLELTGASKDIASGSCRVTRIGNVVTISGWLYHGSKSNPETELQYIPSWAIPINNTVHSCYTAETDAVYAMVVTSFGALKFRYLDWAGMSVNKTGTRSFNVSYVL